MTEKPLNYLVIDTDKMDMAFKIDALLSRLIGSDNFTIAKRKGKNGPVWTIGAWLTEQEHDQFHRTMKRDQDKRWDQEYEELLENR